MPPTRTQKPPKASGSKTSSGSKSSSGSKNLGVSKIKSSLRQTQRLLAKGTLTPDVRVTTERRLKSLQADLAAAQVSAKEKALSARYHGVKFFERQKATRKIKQAKTDDIKFEARVDLNYILHYPKSKKYISLYPPEVRSGAPKTMTDSETDAQREEFRASIRQQMKAGELSTQPELGLASEEKRKTKSAPPKSAPTVADGYEDVEDDEFFGDD